jgi:hypothetical protein
VVLLLVFPTQPHVVDLLPLLLNRTRPDGKLVNSLCEIEACYIFSPLTLVDLSQFISLYLLFPHLCLQGTILRFKKNLSEKRKQEFLEKLAESRNSRMVNSQPTTPRGTPASPPAVVTNTTLAPPATPPATGGTAPTSVVAPASAPPPLRVPAAAAPGTATTLPDAQSHILIAHLRGFLGKLQKADLKARVKSVIELLEIGVIDSVKGEALVDKALEISVMNSTDDEATSAQEKMFREESEIKRNGAWFSDWHRLQHLIKAAKTASKADLEKILTERGKSGSIAAQDAILASLLLSSPDKQALYLYLLLNVEPTKMLKYHNMLIANEMFPDACAFEEWGRRAYHLDEPLLFPFKDLRAKIQEMLHAAATTVSGGGHYKEQTERHWMSARGKVSGGEPSGLTPSTAPVFGGEIPLPVYAKDGGHVIDAQVIKDYIDRMRQFLWDELRREFEAKYGPRPTNGQSRKQNQNQNQNQNRQNSGRGFGQGSRTNFGKGVRGGSELAFDHSTAPKKDSNEKDFQ